MGKAEYIGLLEDNGTLYYSASGHYASYWTLLVAGVSFQGGALAVNGGDGNVYAPIMITDPTDGSFTPMRISGGASNLRPYPFKAVCTNFQFVLSGGTGPIIELWMMPEQRP